MVFFNTEKPEQRRQWQIRASLPVDVWGADALVRSLSNELDGRRRLE
jgi:hypothetical protein